MRDEHGILVGVLPNRYDGIPADHLRNRYLQRHGVSFSNIVVAYGGWKGGLTNDFVAEKVNVAQSVYFFTLVVSKTKTV